MISNRSLTYYKRKVAKESIRRKAVGLPELKELNTKLAQFGYWDPNILQYSHYLVQ